MIQFAADFESSKDMVYKKVHTPILVYKYYENKKDDTGYLKEEEWQEKVIDQEKSKTWVYLWGIKSLDMKIYKTGYSIESFMDYILTFPENMRIYFHNEKFDGSFIIWYLLQDTEKFRQVLPETNKWNNEDLPKEKRHLFEFFDDSNNTDILKWFSQEGYVEKNKCTIDKIFYQTSVNSMGVMYSIKIYVLRDGLPLHTIEIFDSLKLLNFSIRELGESFLNEKGFEKEDYDYEVVRPENRPDLLTDKDFSYLERDIDILAKSLKSLRESEDIEGSNDKQTAASLALDEFKELWYQQVTKRRNGSPRQKDNVFRQLFPEFSEEEDKFVRESYKGGFCYVHPQIKNKINQREDGKGMCVIDVNSLFPYIMLTNPMPYGYGFYSPAEEIYVPKDKDGEEYDYFFTRVRVNFSLKKNKIPSIMLKGTDLIREFNSKGNVKKLPLNKYLESSMNIEVELILSKDDYELMKSQYNLHSCFIVETMYFKTLYGIFDNYITKWGDLKIKADKEGNQTRRQLSKLFLNSLYGKFGSRVTNSFKFFELNDKGALSMKSQVEKKDKPIYCPVAAAITSGGRRKTIEASQKILDYGLEKYGEVMYCYSDTDSIHTKLTKDEVIECLGKEVDWNEETQEETKELGLWALEETDIEFSKFIRAKSYLEKRAKPNKKGSILASGCAGLPQYIQKCLTFEHFKIGAIFVGKLSPCQVQGGMALLEDKFSLKEEKLDGKKKKDNSNNSIKKN